MTLIEVTRKTTTAIRRTAESEAAPADAPGPTAPKIQRVLARLPRRKYLEAFA